MESPPLLRYIPQKSKKRVLFPRGSSSYMDPEVVEISPPINRGSKSEPLKQKEVIHHEVIDVDMDEDCGDVMLIDGKVDTNNKGKEPLANFSFGPFGANLESVDGVQSSKKSCAPGSQNLINVDGFVSDLSYGDDEYVDMYYDDLLYDDDYAILQSHFDNIDIPPGVEAPIPWLPHPAKNENKSATSSSSTNSIFGIQSGDAGFPTVTDSSHSLWLPQPAQISKKSTSKSSSSPRTQVNVAIPHHNEELSSSWSFAEPAQSKKNLAALANSTHSSSQTQRGDANLPSGLKPFKYWHLHESFHGKKKPAVSGGTGYYSSHDQSGGMQLSPGIEPIIGSYLTNSTKKQIGGGSSLSSNSHMPMDGINTLAGVNTSMPKWLSSQTFIKKHSLPSDLPYSGFVDPFDVGHIFPEEEAYTPWVQDPAKSRKNATDVGNSTIPSGSSSSVEKYGNEDEIQKKFQLFKKFDTVQDHSDHHYSCSGSSLKQPSKNWAKKIQDEWKILEKDLPDTIFVRVYESRMDLLRAVIVGAEGTPYHDGLFFFDVFFPSSYPNVPPHVYYHSGGLRINPNLYNCGKVCLSLLNTWSGDQKEKWIPGLSTMLQVLVSIQGLILNAKPFFNEPGYENMSGSAHGEKSSSQYNENTFILSLKTMLYTMRRPPKHFEDLVVGHFWKYAHDILVACKAYMDGAQVGCLVRGGVQDVDEGDKSCSESFKENLAGYINMLVKAFTQVGAKDCEKFLFAAQMGNRVVSPMPKASNYC